MFTEVMDRPEAKSPRETGIRTDHPPPPNEEHGTCRSQPSCAPSLFQTGWTYL